MIDFQPQEEPVKKADAFGVVSMTAAQSTKDDQIPKTDAVNPEWMKRYEKNIHTIKKEAKP